ncbi:Holliday junction branch migration protein RuvA [Rikenella microfusus]|uniref:Holliday junction branch migration complex subunit RuvA n=1 Tax=Rikenella microfusus TaxID=28139 RepID=A0A379MRX6_9BACT|nr:Holliday junction branch migration protein RuvA [Rikenella microfusus]SUE34186.1 Holliday junction ATP-dependent DNA helicase RuvA [Rikenella microfusus]
MYEYIKGKIAELTPAYVVIEAGGIGYLLQISLQTYTALSNAVETTLYIHHIVREDAQIFFGFHQQKERELFRLLISVSGIGANTARIMLSSYSVEEMVQIIATGNIAALKNVKGIGTKTAERAIVDLKNKVLNVAAVSESAPGIFAEVAENIEEAVSALTVLGYPKSACEKIVKSICRENPSLTAEAIIRQALTQL